MRHLLFVILILMTATVSFGDNVNLKTVYQWKYIDFLWKDEKQKEDAINSGKYNASSCVLYDVDKAPDGRIFVTVVREEGVPASLMTVSKKKGSGGPLLNPYPDWSWYENENDCNGSIISVYRVFIKCNRIFVLDCGKIGEDAVCPPKLLIFNLKNNNLIERILIPSHIANNENGIGLLVTPVVYVQDCKHIKDATIFMADIENFGLVIYNKISSFCRIESNYMEPTNPNFTIENQSFYLADGPLGLTMIDTKLYYALLAGNDIYKIDINNLRKCSELNKIETDELTQLAGTLSGQTAAIASEQCAIFFSNIPETSILCQDASKKFESNNTEIIAQDSERLQFASGMKVVNYGITMLILTNRFQRVMNNKLDLNETNFRILSVFIPEIREKTNCFTSCTEDYNEPGHTWPHEPWDGRPWRDNPWYSRPWYDRPWRGRPWHGRPWHRSLL